MGINAKPAQRLLSRVAIEGIFISRCAPKSDQETKSELSQNLDYKLRQYNTWTFYFFRTFCSVFNFIFYLFKKIRMKPIRNKILRQLEDEIL